MCSRVSTSAMESSFFAFLTRSMNPLIIDLFFTEIIIVFGLKTHNITSERRVSGSLLK
jgi:hypothetical protein